MKAKELWANQKNKHWYHNPETGSECMAYNCPKGYVKGRCKKNWIVDGNSRKRHLKEQFGSDYRPKYKSCSFSEDEETEDDFYSFGEDEDIWG